MEALNSCRNWKSKAGTYQFKAYWSKFDPLYGPEYKDTLIKQDLRICRLEEVTRQVMGMETKGKKGKFMNTIKNLMLILKLKKDLDINL